MALYNDQERAMVAVNALVTLYGLASLTFRSDDPTRTNDETNREIGVFLTGLVGCLGLIFLAPTLNLEIPLLVCAAVLGFSLLALLIAYLLRDCWGPWASFCAIFFTVAANASGLLILEAVKH